MLAIWIDQKYSFKIAKKNMWYKILKQKNFTGSGLEGAPKLLNGFFLRLFLCQNYETL